MLILIFVSNFCYSAQDDKNQRLINASLKGKLEEVQSLLNEPFIDINAKDIFGCTSLFCAAMNGYEEIFILLLDHGADVKAKSNEGQSIIEAAAIYGRDIILILLNLYNQYLKEKQILLSNALNPLLSNALNKDLAKIVVEYRSLKFSEFLKIKEE